MSKNAFIHKHMNWYFVSKIVLTYCEKNVAETEKNVSKFKAETRKFAAFLRYVARTIYFFNLLLETFRKGKS